MKRLIALLLCLAGLLTLCACHQKTEESYEVVLDKKLLNISGSSAEELAEDLRNLGEEHYISVEVKGEDTVVAVIPVSQRSFWQEHYAGMLDELKHNIVSLNEKYRLEVNESFDEIDLYYDEEMSLSDVNTYVMYSDLLCAAYQLFSGTAADEWYVKVNIYNCDTGNLVATGDSNTGINYNENDWRNSN